MNKILIIDDDHGITDALKTILEMEGFQVDIATDAKKLFNPHSYMPDLIILDFFLGGLNGMSVAQSIRDNKITHDIPIIMFSADPNNRKKIDPLVVNDFLDKPFEMSDLINLANKYLPS
jgi:DNA-binding response OmpR family regulator